MTTYWLRRIESWLDCVDLVASVLGPGRDLERALSGLDTAALELRHASTLARAH